MADTDTLTSDFTSGLPAFLADGSTSTGTAVVTAGQLVLTAGGGTGQDGMVITGTTHNFTSWYCRMYPLPAEPLAVAFNWLNGSFTGYGWGVGTSSETPGDAELRRNRFSGGSLTHPFAMTYNSTTMRWFRMRIDGSDLAFDTAPDNDLGGGVLGPGTWTERDRLSSWASDLSTWGPSAVTLYHYCSPVTVPAQGNIAYIDAINTNTAALSATITQEGYRHRNDNGSESTATWRADQDTAISLAANIATRLRILADFGGDPAAITPLLQVQRNSDGWLPVLPLNSAPALSWGAGGTIAYSSSGGTSVAPSYPSGITTNSGLVLVVGQKPSTANSGTCTTPSGWTLVGGSGWEGGYGATLGADTGNTKVYVFTKDTVTGSESGTLSVTVGTNNVCWAQILRVQSDIPVTWSAAVGFGGDSSGGNVSVTASSDPGVTVGDFVIGGMCIPTDVTTPAQFSAEAFTQTGVTYNTAVEISEPDSTTGNDIGGFLCYATIASGTSSAAPVLTATAGGTTTNVRGPGFILRLRGTYIPRPCILEPSANIAASAATATTAQLTAPSGKTTGDFQAGSISDDTNPLASFNPTADLYSEWEFSLKAPTGGVVGGDVLTFRLTDNGTPFDTYAVTPTWNIPSAGTAVPLFVHHLRQQGIA